MFEVLLRKHKFVLAFILIITIPLIFFYFKQKSHNHLENCFEKDNPFLKIYQGFQTKYGNEEKIVLAFKDKDIFTNRNLLIIKKLSEELKKIDGVKRVFSLTEDRQAVGSLDSVSFQRIIPLKELKEDQRQSIREKLLKNKRLVNHLVSQDGSTTAVIMELDHLETAEEKKTVLDLIKLKAQKISAGQVKLYFSGSAYIEAEINSLTQRDNKLFSPIILLVIFILGIFIFKKGSLSVFGFLNLVLIIIWGIGFFSLCGEEMNFTTTIIPPVLLAVGMADTVHLLSFWQKSFLESRDVFKALLVTLKSLWFPCLLTSLTTGIGFFSFVTSQVIPIKKVGFFTFTGIFFGFFLTFTFLSGLILLGVRDLPKNSSKNLLVSKTWLDFFLEKISGFVFQRYKLIIIGAILLGFLFLLGLFRVRYETNYVNYLLDSHFLKKDIFFIEQNLGGTVPLEVIIKANSHKIDFTHQKSLELLSEIQSDLLKKVKEFTYSSSVADYFKEMNQAFNSGRQAYYKIPNKPSEIADFYELAGAEVIDRLVSPDKQEARISFYSVFHSNLVAKRIMRKIDLYLTKKLENNFSYQPTGIALLFLILGEKVQQSQRESFLLAFVIISLIMLLICRNFKLAVISMIPNILPIFLTLGLIGWFDFPLDITTVMITSVVLGIAVDDTIHFLFWYKRELSLGKSLPEAIQKSFRIAGRPIIITSFILCLTFLVLIFGSIKPTIAFGLLTSVAIFFSLLGDLLLLPSLLLFFKPKV